MNNLNKHRYNIGLQNKNITLNNIDEGNLPKVIITKDGIPNYLVKNSNYNNTVNTVSTQIEKSVLLPEAGTHPVLPYDETHHVLPEAGTHPVLPYDETHHVLPSAGSFFTNVMFKTQDILKKKLGEAFFTKNYGKIYENVEKNALLYNKIFNFIVENYSNDKTKSEILNSYIQSYITIEVLSYAILLKNNNDIKFNTSKDIINQLIKDKKNIYSQKIYQENNFIIDWIVNINKKIRNLMKIVLNKKSGIQKQSFEMNLGNKEVIIKDFETIFRLGRLKSGGFKKSRKSKKSKKSKKGKKSRKSKTNKKLLKN
jgi:hypothetical protein